MDVSFRTGNPNSNRNISTTDRLHRCYFRELNFLLCLGHLKQSLLPFVVGL